MSLVSTNIIAQFYSEADTPDSPTVILETSNKTAPNETSAYFLFHSKVEDVILTPTSGSIHVVTTNLVNHTEEIISFLNSRSQALKYPNVSNVVITPIGDLLDVSGNPVTYFYDQTRNTIRTEQTCWGLLKVVYKASCQRWLANFEGTCTDPPESEPTNPDDDEPLGGVTSIVVLAHRQGKMLTTLTLSPQGCNATEENEGNANFVSGEQLPSIQMEIDPDEPVRLLRTHGGALKSGCSIRLYPGSISPAMETTSGQISKASPHTQIILTVKETLTFQGSSVVSTKYHPTSGFSARVIGNFIDRWGDTYSPSIILPGRKLTVVEWITKNHYITSSSRDLNVNEVGCANFFGNAMESYGVIEVTYNTTYKKHNFVFDFDDEKNWFKEAFVVAKDGSQTGSLKVAPEQKKGLR